MSTPARPSSPDDPDVRVEPAATRRTAKKKATTTAKKKTTTTTAKKKATPKKKATAAKKKATPKKKATAAKTKATAKKGLAKKKPTATKKTATSKGDTTKKPAAAQKPAGPTRKKTVRRRKVAAAPEPAAPDGGEAAEPEAASPIPPLPEDDDEIVPWEEEEEAPPAPARDAPAGTPPAEILEGIRRGAYHVSALGALDDAQIVELARAQGLKVREKERRHETLYRLLQEGPARKRPETVFVEGLLELHPDGYGFLRSPDRSYSQHPEDVYVAAGLIRKLGLKPGHWVSGTARRSRPGEPLLALHFVEEVNHEDPAELERIQGFENLTVVFPDTRFLLEVAPEDVEMRVMDLFCPLGRGQRALIVSPPRAGKTVILQKLADAIAHNSPDVDIVVLLVDERPEEVTNMRRSVRGEVIASTFDRPASNHIRIAELVMEKVKRMVEYGRHVVLLLDSITRLGRAYNNTSGPSGRILTGGLEAKALTKPKRFFGAARNIEDGGSLTIVATALVETGSRMDDVIFEEFKGSGNMEVVLDRTMANARIWPAINLPASGTRNEDLLLHPEELRRVNLMRKAMAGQDPQSVMDGLREQMVQYKTNAELLMSIG